uniref:Secreted protein n=1 Tax=Strongyloides stercoralis TaxID=6248 RepID=A0A0K0E0Z2_STRER
MKFATIFWCTLGFVSVANVGVNADSKKDEKLTSIWWPTHWIQQTGQLVSTPECMAKFKAASTKVGNSITFLNNRIAENRKVINDLIAKNKTSPVPNIDKEIERIESVIKRNTVNKKIAESKKRSVDSRLKTNALVKDVQAAVEKGKEERKILDFELKIVIAENKVLDLEVEALCISDNDIDSQKRLAQLAVDIAEAKNKVILEQQRLEEFIALKKIKALRDSFVDQGLLLADETSKTEGKKLPELVQDLLKKWESEGASKSTINKDIGLFYSGEIGNEKCPSVLDGEDIWGKFMDEFSCVNL